MKFNKDRNWLAKRAEQEDRHFISVGGLISRLRKKFEELDKGNSKEAMEVHWAWFVAGAYEAQHQIHSKTQEPTCAHGTPWHPVNNA